MKNKKLWKRIMVFGTFDGVHKGHLNFFKQAKKIAPKSYLIASVARDKNVFRIKKEFPERNERERMKILKKIHLIDEVVLGGATKHLPHILKKRPDVIALGYDQKAYVSGLKKDLKRFGLDTKIVRLKPYKEKIYKNKILRKKLNIAFPDRRSKISTK